MQFNQLNSRINYNQSNYITTLDLINKYNLKTKNKCPRIEKLVITFSLTNFLNIFFDKTLNELDSDTQVKTFFLIYLLFSLTPFIKGKFIKNVKSSQTNFLLEIILSNNFSINEFLLRIFLESNNLITNLKLLNFEKKNSISKNNKYIYCSSLEVNKFSEVNTFLNKVLSSTKSNELTFHLNTYFINFPKNLNKANLIKNQFLFWKISL
jgi:hypothetical protein